MKLRVFSREEISKIMRVLFSREKNRKCEYFSEHPKFSEDFGREHFKILVTKKRVNRSFSTLEKARKKKTYVDINTHPKELRFNTEKGGYWVVDDGWCGWLPFFNL